MLDVIPEHRALVVEVVQGRSLRSLLSDPGARGPDADNLDSAELLYLAGSWLSEFQRIPPPHHTEPRLSTRDEVVDLHLRLCRFLGESLSDEPLFDRIARWGADRAREVLPESLPMGLGHGDFAARNVLVEPGGRLTVLDTLARFRTPVYEDLGYFLADLRASGPRRLRRAVGRGSRDLERYGASLLEGYFGPDVPREAVRVFEMQAILDRLAASVERRNRPDGYAQWATARLRTAVLKRTLAPGLLLTGVQGAQPRTRARPGAGNATHGEGRNGARLRVAYITSRFPKLTETFVLYEMVAMEKHGATVELYPLLRERQPVTHPDAERWTRRAHFRPFLSPGILAAHLHYLRQGPLRYLKALAEVLWGTRGSANFFVGALGIFPKTVAFARDMEERRIRHVHAHFATHPALGALIVHRLTGIPFSFTAHGSDLHVDRTMLSAKVDAASFVVAVSGYNRDLIVSTCGEAVSPKVKVIHCGVDTGFFVPGPSRDLRGEVRALCVASFEEVKGHRFLLEACALLRQRGVPFLCELVGDGPLRQSTEARLAELELQPMVRVVGPEPRPAVLKRMQKADLFVLASHPTTEGKREGIPVVLMEAMACGLPVVATAISGIPELVETGRTGLLVPSGDPEALADALERMATDGDLRRRMGAAGRGRVEERFSLEANAAHLRRLFQARGTEPR